MDGGSRGMVGDDGWLEPMNGWGRWMAGADERLGPMDGWGRWMAGANGWLGPMAGWSRLMAGADGWLRPMDGWGRWMGTERNRRHKRQAQAPATNQRPATTDRPTDRPTESRHATYSLTTNTRTAHLSFTQWTSAFGEGCWLSSVLFGFGNRARCACASVFLFGKEKSKILR
jgi:hypothetical protein